MGIAKYYITISRKSYEGNVKKKQFVGPRFCNGTEAVADWSIRGDDREVPRAFVEKKVKDSKEDLDEAAISQMTVDILYDVLTQRLAEVTYGDAQEVTVHVTKNSEGV